MPAFDVLDRKGRAPVRLGEIYQGGASCQSPTPEGADLANRRLVRTAMNADQKSMSPNPPIPPSRGGIIGAFFSGFSVTIASMVTRRPLQKPRPAVPSDHLDRVSDAGLNDRLEGMTDPRRSSPVLTFVGNCRRPASRNSFEIRISAHSFQTQC